MRLKKIQADPTPHSAQDPTERADRWLGHGYQSWISGILALLVLILGIYTAVTMARVVIQTYSPVTYWDQWANVSALMSSQGHIPWRVLWDQHNEHRILLGRLAGFADLLLFGGRNVFLLTSIYLIQVLHLGLFAWVLRRFGSFSLTATGTALGFFAFCFFSLIQIENFMWGFQIVFVLVGFAASGAFACMVWYACASQKSGRVAIVPLVLCLLAAVAAECSLSSGVMVWPILSLAAFTLRLPRRVQVVVGVTGILAVTAYLWGYHSPSYHSNPWTTIRHPFSVAQFVVAYFASTWDSTAARAGTSLEVSITLTALALAVAGLGALLTLMRRSAEPLGVFLYSNIAFVVLTATITALGRINFGIGSAAASRYQTVAVVFWICLSALLLGRVGSAERRPWLIEVQVGVLVLMLAGISNFDAQAGVARQHQADMAKGFAALATNPSDQESLKLVYPDPTLLPAAYEFMHAHHMGPEVPGIVDRVVNGHPIVSASRCLGYVDVAKPSNAPAGTYFVAGWAWDVAAQKPPTAVFLATSAGTMIGAANTRGERPDVLKTLPQVNSVYTGWYAILPVSHGQDIQVFAVLDDAKAACPVPNRFHVP